MLKYKERIAYFVLLAVCLILFLFFGNKFIGIILLALLLYGLVGVISLFLMSKGIETEIIVPDVDVKRGTETKLVLSLVNNSLFPILKLAIDLKLENLLNGESETIETGFSVLPKSRDTKEIVIENPHLGMVKVSALNPRVSDFLDVFSRHIEIEKAETKGFAVIPEYDELSIAPEDFDRYDMESYRFADNVVGADTSETVSIREYDSGDDVRRIHWKLSAKSDSPMIREPGFPVDNRLLILVDKRIKDCNRIDDYTQYAVSLSYTLMNKGIAHLIGWEDQGFQLHRIMDEASFYLMLNMLLQAPSNPGNMDVVTSFLSSNVDRNIGNFLLIVEEDVDNEMINRLSEYGYVDTLTPGKNK